MRKSTRQLADGLHFLSLEQSSFGLLPLRDLLLELPIGFGKLGRAYLHLLVQ